MKVMIATPTTGMVHSIYASSLASMIVYYQNMPVFEEPEPERQDVSLLMMIGSSIPDNRERIVEETLGKGCTHLLFLDDDMGFEPECLNIALGRQKPIILGNYRMKAPPYPFLSRNPENTEQIITSDKSTGLEPCSFGGFGFSLFERQVLETVKRPRFLPKWSEQYKCYTTEDKPFFEACITAGFQPLVDHEVSKRIWHNGSYEYRYKGN